MKKSNIIITVFSLLMLAGCTTDKFSDSKDGQIPVQLCVSQDVSASFTRTTNDLHTATTGFVVNETMKVFMKNSGTTNSKIYKVSSTSGTNPKIATLAPNTENDPLYYPTGTSGSVQLYAVYPASITEGGTHTVAYSQTDDANYQSSDLMYSAAKTVNLNDKENQQALSSFAHKLVRLKLNIIKASDVSSVTEVKMVNVKRRVTVSTLNESSITVGTGTSTGDSNGDNILIFSGTNSETTQQTYYVVFPKQVASGNDWNGTNFLTVTADGSTVNYTLTKEFTAGNQYELTLNINAAALNTTVNITGWTNTTSQTIEPTVEVGITLPDRTPAGVNAVDLGLYVGGAASGKKLLWADRNIGATSETDYGLYFAWGDVIGRSGAVSSGTTAADGYSYSWTNTPYNYGSSSFAATKYTSSDGKTNLEKCDDAAYMNWGGKWRMPTQAEMDELLRTWPSYSGSGTKIPGYTWTWCNGSSTKYNDSTVKGWKITRDEGGATIFLPVAGYRQGTSVINQSSNCCYWSSSLYEDNPYDAWGYYLTSLYGYESHGNRYDGYSVRAVCEE